MWILKERKRVMNQKILNSIYYIMDMAKVQTLKPTQYRQDTSNISKLTQTEENKEEKDNADWASSTQVSFFILDNWCSCNDIPFDSLAPPPRLSFSHGSANPFTTCSALSSVCFVSFSVSHWMHLVSFRIIHLFHVFLLSTLPAHDLSVSITSLLLPTSFLPIFSFSNLGFFVHLSQNNLYSIILYYDPSSTFKLPLLIFLKLEHF